ncbi:MAG: thioredoxin domain-containing protein [Phototrophicaceae bacterium]
MNILNQFSYPLIGIGVTIGIFLLLTRYFKVRWYITTITQLVIIALFVSGFVILRPGGGNVTSAADALDQIGNGRPTFVDFYSNYCSGCLAFSPTIDRLEADLGDEFNFLRIDIHTNLGRSLREELGFSFTPEFVLYDGQGNEVWRDHVPPTSGQLAQVRSGGTP